MFSSTLRGDVQHLVTLRDNLPCHECLADVPFLALYSLIIWNYSMPPETRTAHADET